MSVHSDNNMVYALLTWFTHFPSKSPATAVCMRLSDPHFQLSQLFQSTFKVELATSVGRMDAEAHAIDWTYKSNKMLKFGDEFNAIMHGHMGI